MIFNVSDSAEINPIDRVRNRIEVLVKERSVKIEVFGIIERMKELREFERIHSGELIMAERIGKILRIDKLNIVVIDDPFVEENIAVMKIVDMNIEIMNPFVEEVERARVSGKEIAK